ncbi:hypothetical protein AR158_c326R [Paramecium bursaria Chlorella virus AR158]|uniref:hypothetical protein n=1 Tax=Paramecium bursaria Chlorella virus AR158 TaxID=380598 RepID=UPI00015AA92A|nr:hypothetical protein AR158_c326R [Paramecium bursaria Chlorella virus AR158]ABU43871.1 hypothetical protein AR158_c326R [Paramecium bursaria Chlorella virus AR158]
MSTCDRMILYHLKFLYVLIGVIFEHYVFRFQIINNRIYRFFVHMFPRFHVDRCNDSFRNIEVVQHVK